jgi:hypothetical protein
MKEYWVFESTLLGYIAFWATSQSPYHAPDGLTEVLKEVKARLDRERKAMPDSRYSFPHPDTVSCDRFKLSGLLDRHLFAQETVQTWNSRKNGNTSPFGFSSRYDKPSPDNDFIDLDALKGNIIRSCQDHCEREHREDRRAFGRLNRIGRAIKNKLFPVPEPQGPGQSVNLPVGGWPENDPPLGKI